MVSGKWVLSPNQGVTTVKSMSIAQIELLEAAGAGPLLAQTDQRGDRLRQKPLEQEQDHEQENGSAAAGPGSMWACGFALGSRGCRLGPLAASNLAAIGFN